MGECRFRSVITSYSIHYTKLYDGYSCLVALDGDTPKWGGIVTGPSQAGEAQGGCNAEEGGVASGDNQGGVGEFGPVITSYSIHYTKLYE